MTTVVRTVDPRRPDPTTVDEAVLTLRAGGLVAFPTETVYGLGAVAADAQAVNRVFEVKGRPSTDPLIVHGADVASLVPLVRRWHEAADALARAFWPGPLTMVLDRSELVIDAVTGGGGTVALRVPAHPVAESILRGLGMPVAAPSANRFGRVSPTNAGHVVSELGGLIPLVIDAGPTPLGVESTVVDLTGPTARVLRPGGVTLEDLRGVLDRVEFVERSVTPDGELARSPGSMVGHYAPATPIALVDAAPDVITQLVDALARFSVRAVAIELPGDGESAARELYGRLREADAGGFDLLLGADRVVRRDRPGGERPPVPCGPRTHRRRRRTGIRRAPPCTGGTMRRRGTGSRGRLRSDARRWLTIGSVVSMLVAFAGCSMSVDTAEVAESESTTSALSGIESAPQIVPEIPTENAPPSGTPPVLRAPENRSATARAGPSTTSSTTSQAPTTSVDPAAASAVEGLTSESQRRLAASALSMIRYDWRRKLPGWEIRFLPGRSGYRGSTFPDAKVIEIYVRAGESPESLAHVIAHEIGHAIDTSRFSDVQRQVWRTARGIPPEVPWWPGDGAADYRTGAGDFAESFAYSQVGTDWFSELAAPPGPVERTVLSGMVG